MRIEELGPVGPKAGRDHRNGISGAASEMAGLARASLKATATFRLPVIPSCASAGVCACRGLRAWPQALCRRLGHGVGLPCPLRIASSCVSSRKPPLKVSFLTPGVARSAASFLEFHRILTNISPLNKSQHTMFLSATDASGGVFVADLVFVLATLAFFSVAIIYLRGCERLR